MLINLRNALMTGGAGAPPVDKYILRLKSGMDLRCYAMIPDGDFTLSFWFKGYTIGANNELFLFGWRDLGWGGTRSNFVSQGLNFRYATGSSATDFTALAPKTYATDAQWRHYTYRRNGTAVQVQIDGVSKLSATVTASHKNDGTPLSIGSIGNDSNGQWRRGDKSIGFFCLFGRALTDREIAELAATRTLQASGGLFNNLICGYELSSDTQLADVTGNYPLTLYNKASESVEYSDLLPA